LVRASRPKPVDLLSHSRDQTCGGNLRRGLMGATNRRMGKKNPDTHFKSITLTI